MANTGVGSNALILEVLDRNNYKHWRSRLKTYLLVEDLWEVVEAGVDPPKRDNDDADYKAWAKKNVRALYAIQNSCGRELFSYISELETAKGAWEALEQECRVERGFGEGDGDYDLYQEFMYYLIDNRWDRARSCLGEIDVRSVVGLTVYPGETPLHVAAMRGLADIVKELVPLMTEEDFKRTTHFSNTALHLAVENGNVRVVKELPVRLMGEVKDLKGNTALQVALQLGKVDIASEVADLMKREDLILKNNDGDTALHIAVKNRQANFVSCFVDRIEREAGFKIQNNRGDTALHTAVKEGEAGIVKKLVHLMTEEALKVKNEDGYTALHLAIRMWNTDMVTEFVSRERGADDYESYTPFATHVIDRDWDKAREYLRNLDDPCNAITARILLRYTALHLAAREGHVDLIKEWVLLLRTREELLELKTTQDFKAFGCVLDLDVSEGVVMEKAKHMVEQYQKKLCIILEMQDAEDNLTPLHLAAMRGHVDIVKELGPLMRQEGLELKTNRGGTALQIAVRMGNVDIVKELLPLMRQEGFEIQDTDGFTALHMAVLKGDIALVKELAPLMSQEGLEIQDTAGKTALLRAVVKGVIAIVKELLLFMRQEGLEIQDTDGVTALYMAVKNGDITVVRVLAPLMRQEALELKTYEGNNPLHLAAKWGNMNIAKELMPLMRNHALEHENVQGYTALVCAFNARKDEVVMEIAKYMAENNSKVLGKPMPPTDEIPVVRAIRLGKWKLARYLYSVTPLKVLKGPHGSSLICYCLDSSKGIDLALDLLRRGPTLAFTTNATLTGGTPIMKLAQLHFAFLSGTRLTWWKRWFYDYIHIREVDHANIDHMFIDVVESKDDHNTKENFSWSVMSLYRRFSKRLYIFIGIQHIYKVKSTHERIFQILRCMGEEIKNKSDNYQMSPDEQATVRKSILKAIELGHFEFVTQLCKVHPELLLNTYREGEKKSSIFHFAIENRLEEVYNLIYELEEEKRHSISIRVVEHGNTMLYVAANLSSRPQFDRIQDASLQMQNELQWFKEVESVVPLEMHERRNTSDGLTARELFTKTHKNLLDDAENSTKRTAASCTVVGALIVTMMFAAAFTVPGGNDGNTGLPLMLHRKLFKVFIVSDTISLVSSTTSVITFLGILTSRFAEDDFLKSLPTKMMLGLFTLFLSIATMMIAFSCALAIMLNGEARIVIPCVLFACFPAISFVWLLFPLLGKIFMSTYGPGRFAKRQKDSDFFENHQEFDSYFTDEST